MKNNFDFLRLIFALFVVIAHSYPLSGNTIENQWIYKLTNRQIELSNIGLNGFFVLSGFLIYQSLERSKSLLNYFWKRILRIFPALLVVLVLTVLLAPMVYYNPVAYLKNKDVFTYVFRNITLLKMQYGISGVFESNPFPQAINGSLWTIVYEFSLYLFLSAFVFIQKKHVKSLLLLGVFILMIVGYNFFMDTMQSIKWYDYELKHLLNLGTFFVGGALLASINLEYYLVSKHMKYSFALLSFVLILIVLHFKLYDATKHVFFTIFVLIIGLMSFHPINKLNKIGDFSFGIYIYSFPIQQTLMYFFKLSTIELIIFSVSNALVFGALSWYFVEKKMLKYKTIFD